MKVSFQSTLEEQRELQQLTDRRAATRYGPAWLSKGYWWLFLPAAIVGLGFGFGRFDIVLVCFVVFYVGGELFGYIWRQLYEGRLEKEATQQVQWTVTIDDSGLTLESEESRQWYAWTTFASIEKTANYVFVHHGEGGGFVYVPRRTFSSEAECDAFIALVKSRLPKPAPTN